MSVMGVEGAGNRGSAGRLRAAQRPERADCESLLKIQPSLVYDSISVFHITEDFSSVFSTF